MLIAPFAIPRGPHIRRHGPYGYVNYGSYKEWLRDEFQFRCVFCLHREKWERRGWRVFQIDHIIPKSIDPSRECLYENLQYVCDSCNGHKSTKDLPDPCRFDYSQHYQFEDDGRVTPLTESGEMYIEILELDDPDLVRYRRKVVATLRQLEDAAKKKEIDDVDLVEELEETFGYPRDVPDLRRKSRTRNSKPGSEYQCYFVRLVNGEIPRIY